jgi:hypothetical protein
MYRETLEIMETKDRLEMRDTQVPLVPKVLLEDLEQGYAECVLMSGHPSNAASFSIPLYFSLRHYVAVIGKLHCKNEWIKHNPPELQLL